LIRRSYPPGKRAVFNTGGATAQPEDGRQFVSAPRSCCIVIGARSGSFGNFEISPAAAMAELGASRTFVVFRELKTSTTAVIFVERY